MRLDTKSQTCIYKTQLFKAEGGRQTFTCGPW